MTVSSLNHLPSFISPLQTNPKDLGNISLPGYKSRSNSSISSTFFFTLLKRLEETDCRSALTDFTKCPSCCVCLAVTEEVNTVKAGESRRVHDAQLIIKQQVPDTDEEQNSFVVD